MPAWRKLAALPRWKSATKSALPAGHHQFVWDQNSLMTPIPIEELNVSIAAAQVRKTFRLRPPIVPPGGPRLPEVTAHNPD